MMTEITQTPELYRTIDLSSHNAKLDSKSQYPGSHRVPLDFSMRSWTRHDLSIFQQQERFMYTLGARPELGPHVRKLHWTVMDLSHPHEEEWDDT